MCFLPHPGFFTRASRSDRPSNLAHPETSVSGYALIEATSVPERKEGLKRKAAARSLWNPGRSEGPPASGKRIKGSGGGQRVVNRLTLPGGSGSGASDGRKGSPFAAPQDSRRETDRTAWRQPFLCRWSEAGTGSRPQTSSKAILNPQAAKRFPYRFRLMSSWSI